MKLLSICLLCSVLFGCGVYSHEKVIITETNYLDGRVEIKTEKCTTSIASTREVKSGDINVTENCGLNGGAGSLGINQKLVDALFSIAKAVVIP